MPRLSRVLRVAAVQLEVSRATFSSLESFRDAVTSPLGRAARGFSPDLIVFPEYAAALLALLRYRDVLAGARTVAEGIRRLHAARPDAGSPDAGSPGAELSGGGMPGAPPAVAAVLRPLFLEESGSVESAVREIFGGLARRSGATVISGSFFARHPRDAGPEELRNRAYVFGTDGGLLYAQDKVFLTDFEKEMLGVSPGRVEDAALFPAADAEVALTICRDTFHPEWESIFKGADLWVDIKANGTVYTPQQELDFRGALPARLRGSGVCRGLTVCLVGRVLDLRWEGESSVERLRPGGVISVKRAATATHGALLRAELPL